MAKNQWAALSTGKREVALLESGPWDEIPALFLPSKILSTCFEIAADPPPNIQKLIALLAWVNPTDLSEFYSKLKTQLESTLIADKEREKWKSHSLYKENTKPQLEAICRKLNIPVTSSITKHQLVSLIAQKRGISEPANSLPLYSSRITSLPTSTSAISHMPVAQLRAVLQHHNVSVSGTKDQLVLKVYLLRHGRTAAISAKEEQVKDLIQITKQLIFAQRKLQLSTHTYQQRTYTSTTCKHYIIVEGVRSETDLTNIFSPLVGFIDAFRFNVGTVILHGWSRMFHFCMNKCPQIFVYQVQVLLETLFKHWKCVINNKKLYMVCVVWPIFTWCVHIILCR